MNAPTGEVTFWFSDIEGSTRLWERFPRDMATVLERHFELLLEIHERHGGRFVEGTGDGVYTVFTDAAGAVQAAIAVQQACMAEDWGVVGDIKARVGLHTGRAAVQGDAYHGAEVNRTARLMSCGHGGQVLISGATHALVSDDPLPDVTYEFMGRHELKDLDRPMAIYQVLHPDLPSEFPPLKSLSVAPNNLPIELSSLVGRDRDLERLHDMVIERSLVTLVGPTGVGKTRLALHLGAELLDNHRDGVWLVSLTDAHGFDDVHEALASVLNVRRASDSDLLDELGDHLRLKEIVLILDNCEHVVEEAATTIAALLRRCPSLTFLATSQVPLEVEGEIAWPVQGLPFPNYRAEVSFEDWQNYPAVELFVERAREARPTWDITLDNYVDVIEATRKLDGVPLALELAATRARVVSVADLNRKLDSERFKLLRGGRRSGPARHRTLDDAIGWSYGLLDEEQRTVFNRLGVFTDSFSLEAAEHVGARGDVDDVEVLDAVAELVERSLLERLQVAGETRYRMLGSVRHYARRNLVEDELERALEAHLGHYLLVARRAEAGLTGPDQHLWLRRIHADVHNVEAAVGWALDSGHAEEAAGLASALHLYWTVRNPHLGYRLMARIVAALDDGIPDAIEAEALLVGGALLALAGELGPGERLLERAVDMSRAIEDRHLIGRAAHHLAHAVYLTAEHDEVRKLIDEAVRSLSTTNDTQSFVEASLLHAAWELEHGSRDEAVRIATETHGLAEDADVPRSRAEALEALALANIVTGNGFRAVPLLRDALDLYAHIRDLARSAQCIEFVAGWAVENGQARRAAQLLGAADRLRGELRVPPPGPRAWGQERALRESREALGPIAFADAFADGQGLDLGDATWLAHETLNRLAV